MFAYYMFMIYASTSDVSPFVVACKGCRENIRAPVETMPASWIIAKCPLCGQRRRYLPTEIFQGRISRALLRKSGRTGDKRWAR